MVVEGEGTGGVMEVAMGEEVDTMVVVMAGQLVAIGLALEVVVAVMQVLVVVKVV